MNDADVTLRKRAKMNTEINGGGFFTGQLRKTSQVSLSSVSDCLSDSSEDGAHIERKTSLQEVGKNVEDKRALYKQRGRSMSDGEARKLKNDDPNFEVFPSLPNSVLEKLGLRGDGPRAHMSEEELEQKFTSLALAFSIDAATIKDRCERQRRSRDQTENNLHMEIERLKEKLTLMQPLCTDYEKAELFSMIITQIEILMNATSLVSMSAERFGSVQHEERLTESVGLMVSHVQMLKQQRDGAKRQLQYTKKVLQNSADFPGNGAISSVQALSPVSPNKKIISQRRASIATFTEQPPTEQKMFKENKKITRRISDLSLRSPVMNRIIRPNRLELGGELVKIKEGFTEMELVNENEIISDTENDESQSESRSNISSPEEGTKKEIDISKLPLREKLSYKCLNLIHNAEDLYQTWMEDGTLHEVCHFCALLCFSFSLIIMFNILVEYEYANRGIVPWTIWTYDNNNNVKSV